MKRELDLKRLEELAATGATQKEAAKALGFNYGTLVSRFSYEPELREAWNRGRKLINGSSKKAAPSTASKSEVVPTKGPEADAVLAAIAAGEHTMPKIRVATGLSYDQIDAALYKLQYDHRLITVEKKNGQTNNYSIATAPPSPAPSDNPSPAPTPVETIAAKAPEPLNGNGHHEPLPDNTPLEVEETVVDLPIKGPVIRALESARVELLYQRVWGKSSPHIDEVIDRIEDELFRAVAAAGA